MVSHSLVTTGVVSRLFKGSELTSSFRLGPCFLPCTHIRTLQGSFLPELVRSQDVPVPEPMSSFGEAGLSGQVEHHDNSYPVSAFLDGFSLRHCAGPWRCNEPRSLCAVLCSLLWLCQPCRFPSLNWRPLQRLVTSSQRYSKGCRGRKGPLGILKKTFFSVIQEQGNKVFLLLLVCIQHLSEKDRPITDYTM